MQSVRSSNIIVSTWGYICCCSEKQDWIVRPLSPLVGGRDGRLCLLSWKFVCWSLLSRRITGLCPLMMNTHSCSLLWVVSVNWLLVILHHTVFLSDWMLAGVCLHMTLHRGEWRVQLGQSVKTDRGTQSVRPCERGLTVLPKLLYWQVTQLKISIHFWCICNIEVFVCFCTALLWRIGSPGAPWFGNEPWLPLTARGCSTRMAAASSSHFF